jgi:protein phosphatase PTC7
MFMNKEILYKNLDAYDREISKQGTENFEIVFRSESQEHDFNFPFQVGTHGDDPRVSIENKVDLLPGDLVILGTDGVFDNLYDFQILQTVESYSKRGSFNATELADVLTKEAFDFSQNNRYLSPFCSNMLKQKNQACLGGKADDITISLGRVEIE